MDKYTGNEDCVKCGAVHTAIDVSDNQKMIRPAFIPATETVPEHLLLQCRTCFFQWDVACKDAA